MTNEIASAFSGGPFAFTLIIKDLAETKEFYGAKLGLEQVYGDENSVLYRFGKSFLNLLVESQGPELIEPAKLGDLAAGVTAVYTVSHPDVDVVASQLEAAGVKLLNGPMDRPWGVRTLSFQDPSGHVFEVANHS